MELIHDIEDMMTRASALGAEGKRVALVPTMGALHDGHLELVREARAHSDIIVVSIFVNPTQFGPTEDYDRYPRRLEEDIELLRSLAADGVIVFAPGVEDMYPGGHLERQPIRFTVRELDRWLCGRYREGHFDGVVTVVAKLLNIVRPDVAVFGLKDAQQFVILKRLARDYFFGTRLIGVPTVREDDGLAMSSRNRYLNHEERLQARVLSKAITDAEAAVKRGEQRVLGIVTAMRDTIGQSELAKLQYAEVVSADDLQPLETIESGMEVLVAVAAYFGETRLIDSAFVTAP